MPLKAIGDPGPPKIVEIQEKYSAVEGWIFYSFFEVKLFCRYLYLLSLIESVTEYYDLLLRLEIKRCIKEKSLGNIFVFWAKFSRISGEKKIRGEPEKKEL